MKVEVSTWSHVETSFTVRDTNLVESHDSSSSKAVVSNHNEDKNEGTNKDMPSNHKKLLRQGRSFTTTTSPTVEETSAAEEVRWASSGMHNDIVVGFIEHTKSSLSYYKNHHSSSSSSRKRRKVSSNSKRILQYYSEEELHNREDRIPVLTVSSQNHIAVMVEEDDTMGNNNEQRIQESAILQFHHSHYRGDSNTTTVTTTKIRPTTKPVMNTTIPPVYDIHHHRMYAVQCNNTKIICHYQEITNATTSTNGDGSFQQDVRDEPPTVTCEVTIPCGIQSLAILYLPSPSEVNHLKENTKNPNSRSILYGTCADSKLFMVWTQSVGNTRHNNSKDDTSSKQTQKSLQLVIQYLDTTYSAVTTTSTSTIKPHHHLNPSYQNDTNHTHSTKPTWNHPHSQQHAGTIAVVCHPVDAAISSNNNSDGVTMSKKRSVGTNESPSTNVQMESSIVCFYQVFFSPTSILLVRQHVRFLHEPSIVSSTVSASTIAGTPQSISPATTYYTLHSDDHHINNVTSMQFHNQNPIEDLKVLGTTSCSESKENNSSTIVLSYRSIRHGSVTGNAPSTLVTKMTGHEMNGSSTHISSVTTAKPRYDYFYTTLLTSPRRVISSSLSSFPFILPHMDDVVQHTCLVGPSMIGVLTQQCKQVYFYDLYRGGLIHIAQPFPTTRMNKLIGDTPITCTSLLADTKRSKIAVTYISHGDTKKYCIAYASVGLSNGNNSFSKSTGPISLADGLVAAAASSNMFYGMVGNLICPTRILHPDVDKLYDNCQNETMIPQQTAIHKAVQLFHEMYEKIKDAGIESSEPSFVLKVFDNAMQSASVVECRKSQIVSKDNYLTISEKGLENGKIVLTNGIKSDNLHNPLPLKDVKKNGGIVVNGLHKTNDVSSPTTAKDQLHLNGSGNHHQLKRMNDSSKTRPKQKHYQLSEMPQILIDTATSIMLAILGMNISHPNTAHSIRNDARIILRRLIRCGKVSARTQLKFIPTGSSQIIPGSSGFTHLLRSLELSRVEHANGEVWSAYTPFDLICDMFEYCGDISERQMVVSLRYTLFNTRPVDVAAYFVRNKNVSGTDSLRQLGSNLLLMLKQDVSNLEKKTLLQHKLVVAATALMIHRITNFSIGFNVALLRNAFETEFDATEFQVLLRLAMEMLSNPDKFHLPASSKSPMKNLLKLIMTLYDCIPAFKADSNAIDPTHMEHLLSNLTAASRRMLSMQKLLQATIDSISQSTESTLRQIEPNQPVNNVLDRPKQTPKPTASLPPYQIERLLF